MSDARDRVEHLANAVSMLRPSFAGAHIDAAAMLRAQHEEITRLRAALSAPPPVVPAVTECNDNDSPWLICKTCAAAGQCAKAPPTDAEEWLQRRYGAMRGHPEWRALMEARSTRARRLRAPQAPTQRNPADNQSQPQR